MATSVGTDRVKVVFKESIDLLTGAMFATVLEFFAALSRTPPPRAMVVMPSDSRTAQKLKLQLQAWQKEGALEAWSHATRRLLLVSIDHDLIGARFRGPHLALAAVDLAHVGVGARGLEALELFGGGIEAQHGLRGPLRGPDLVGLVHVDRVELSALAGRLPHRPFAALRFVAAEIPRVPFGHPDRSLGVGPHAPRALVARRRLDDRGGAGSAVDARDVRAGERRVVHRAVRGGLDAVGAAAPRRFEYLHVAGLRIEAAIDAALPGEPEHALQIEGGGVEVGVARVVGQLPHLDLLRIGTTARVHSHDGILPAVGEPHSTIRPRYDAVRRGARAQGNEIEFSALGIEDAELAAALHRDPHRAVGRGKFDFV